MVMTRAMRERAAASRRVELSPDEWKSVAGHLHGAFSGNVRGVLRGVCRAARDGVDRAAAAAAAKAPKGKCFI